MYDVIFLFRNLKNFPFIFVILFFKHSFFNPTASQVVWILFSLYKSFNPKKTEKKMFIVVFYFLSCSFLDPKKRKNLNFVLKSEFLCDLHFMLLAFQDSCDIDWFLFVEFRNLHEAMLFFISLYFVLIISRLSISHLILFLLFFNKAFYLREQLLDIIMEWNEFYSFGEFHSFTRS